LASLEIVPGQVVRGAAGGRPTLLIDGPGLDVIGREVRFENIDFVFSPSLNAQPSPPHLLRLSCSLAEFRGCTFRSHDLTALPTGIHWNGRPEVSSVELPTGRLHLTSCVFQGLATVIDHHAPGALVVEVDNSLHLGRGPLVRLHHAPTPDEPVLIGLRRFTLRGGGAVLECGYDTLANDPGKLTIQATDCAFLPAAGQGLTVFAGAEPPDRLLRNLAWSGSGSVIAPEAPLAVWRQPGGAVAPANDAGLEVAGLVRSGVTFAGDAAAGPSASGIVRWQAPLHSTDPPGVDPRVLPVWALPTKAAGPLHLGGGASGPQHPTSTTVR
jgi:hypothetical protein